MYLHAAPASGQLGRSRASLKSLPQTVTSTKGSMPLADTERSLVYSDDPVYPGQKHPIGPASRAGGTSIGLQTASTKRSAPRGASLDRWRPPTTAGFILPASLDHPAGPGQFSPTEIASALEKSGHHLRLCGGALDMGDHTADDGSVPAVTGFAQFPIAPTSAVGSTIITQRVVSKRRNPTSASFTLRSMPTVKRHGPLDNTYDKSYENMESIWTRPSSIMDKGERQPAPEAHDYKVSGQAKW